jgi:hypothetical protein
MNYQDLTLKALKDLLRDRNIAGRSKATTKEKAIALLFECDRLSAENSERLGLKPCISIQQPWAWAIFHLGKDVENRSWQPPRLGHFYIHASKTYNHAAAAWIEKTFGVRPPGPDDLPMGAIIGSVEVVGCIQDSASPWAIAGQFHWQLHKPVEISPISCLGELRIFYRHISPDTEPDPKPDRDSAKEKAIALLEECDRLSAENAPVENFTGEPPLPPAPPIPEPEPEPEPEDESKYTDGVQPNKCAQCGSFETWPERDGGYFCENCNYRFTPPDPKAECFQATLEKAAKLKSLMGQTLAPAENSTETMCFNANLDNQKINRRERIETSITQSPSGTAVVNQVASTASIAESIPQSFNDVKTTDNDAAILIMANGWSTEEESSILKTSERSKSRDA